MDRVQFETSHWAPFERQPSVTKTLGHRVWNRSLTKHRYSRRIRQLLESCAVNSSLEHPLRSTSEPSHTPTRKLLHAPESRGGCISSCETAKPFRGALDSVNSNTELSSQGVMAQPLQRLPPRRESVRFGRIRQNDASPYMAVRTMCDRLLIFADCVCIRAGQFLTASEKGMLVIWNSVLSHDLKHAAR